MSSAMCNNSAGSQINFFMPRTPDVVAAASPEPAAAPKNATATATKNGPQVLTFALQRRPRATRASSNKVRTGCVTCKRRHVKCDEAKPSCQRCVKWKGFCTGYETFTSDSSASTPTPDADYNGDAGTEHQTSVAVSGDASLLLLEPTATFFQDDTERLYFDRWLARRTRLGGGLFDERLWAETVPQLSRQHASVRYAVAAAGAIAEALGHSMGPTHPARMAAGGPHYRAALSYYGRAIREVRGSRTDTGTGSLRAAVVCCLLFVSFEALHGDRRAAFSHIDNGQRMMDELLRVAACDGGPARDGGGSVIGDEAVEIDVLHVFQRLILQSWSCGVLRRRRRRRPRQTSGGSDGDDARAPPDEPWCCRGGSGRRCVVEKMPSSFATLQGARRWWDVTQHFVIHSSSIVLRITHLGLGDDLLSECDERVREHMGAGDKGGPSAATSPEHWREFKDVLERWRGGFEPLWEAAAKSRHEDEKSYAQAALLRAHYLTMHGCVHAPLGCDRESVARLTPTYREVVELCGGLLAYQRRSSGFGGGAGGGEVFTMDMGPTWPLLLAGTRCRDADVRDEAIRLLHENPRRDGLWDSRTFYALTARNRALEMSNAQEGSREEQWWRLQHRSAYVDEQGRLMARALHKNTLTGTWEFCEDDLSRFLLD